MTFIPDLGRYDYYPAPMEALAVGWLDISEPFTTGTCPPDVRDRLAEFSRQPVRLMRGIHYCQFCAAIAEPPRLLRADIRLYESPDVACGNGEIWLTAPNGVYYAAPMMIVHYVDDHHYLPPDVFVAAVRIGVPTEGLS